MRAAFALAFLLCLSEPAVPQDAAAPSAPLKLSHDEFAGKNIISKVAPVYPPLARQARIQGTVILDVIIDTTGAVTNVRLISGHPMLAPAAIEAVKKWQYAPYLLNGSPVAVDTTVEVHFQLSERVRGPVENPSQFVTVEPPGNEDSTTLIATKAVEPIYPLGAGQTAQGRVWVRMLVSETGEVKTADVLSDDAFFAKAATDAALQWQFKPFMRNGIAIPETTRVLFVVAPLGRIDDGDADPKISDDAPDTAKTEDVPWRVRVPAGVMMGLLMNRVQAVYPALAKAARLDGIVILQVHISKDGTVLGVRPISGYQTLANASVEAIRQWRYRPYRLMGIPVEVETQIEIRFNVQ